MISMGFAEHFFGGQNQPRRGVDNTEYEREALFRAELNRIASEVAAALAAPHSEDELGAHHQALDALDAANRELGELMKTERFFVDDPEFARQIFQIQLRIIEGKARAMRVNNPAASTLARPFVHKPKKRR